MNTFLSLKKYNMVIDYSAKGKELLEEVNKKNKDISAKTISYPFRELANLYQKKQLIIRPNFQRFYRWDKYQKTNFIESLLLGLPIPPIFVSKVGKTRELVDGLQRLSTMFEFFGILKIKIDASKSIGDGLMGTEYFPSLEGFTFDRLPEELRFRLEYNYRMEVVILEDASKIQDTKYELFYRLNTGGSSLSNQEVRSVIIIMNNQKFYDELVKLKNGKAFNNIITISDREAEEQFDLELVIRYFAVKNYDENDGKIKSIKRFLDIKVMKFFKKFNLEDEHSNFTNVFNFLDKNFGSSPFRKYIPKDKRFKGRMNISAYDIIAAGIGYNLERGNINLVKDKNWIINRIHTLMENDYFKQHTRVGVTSEGKLNFSIEFGRDYFKNS